MIYLVSGQTRIYPTEDIQEASIQDCLDYFMDKSIVEVDTETESNLRVPKYLPNPFESRALSLQLGDAYNQFVIDPNSVDASQLRSIFEDPTKLKIFCNAAFDLRFLYHWGFKVKNIHDIFLAECIIVKGKDVPKGYRGLESMADRYLGVTLSKEVRGQIHWRGLDDTVIRYAAKDVQHMNAIREKQLIEIDKINSTEYLRFENRYALALAKVAYRGFKVDPLKWLQVKEDNSRKLVTYEQELSDYIINNNLHKYIDRQLFGIVCSIKWTSSKQVLPLFQDLGVDTTVRDKEKGGDKDSVDIKHLKKQAHKFPILPIYIKYKELQKEITTYGEEFIKNNLNPVTGRIHPEMFQILETSRISQNNPNLQNIPASDDEGNTHPLRGCFIAEEGNTLIVADFSQQEPKVTAHYCQDPYLLDFILNGDGDSHSFISTMISEYLLGEHVTVTKKNNPFVPSIGKRIRDVGKTINLGRDLSNIYEPYFWYLG